MRKRVLVLELALAGFLGLTALASCGTKTNPSTSVVSTSVAPTTVTTSEGMQGATGLYSYVNSSYAEKTKIIGALEKYALKTHLAGIPLEETTSYAVFNDRVQLGTENYIPNYGFSTLRDGKLTADLDYEAVAAWKKYYHTDMIKNYYTLNAMNDDTGDVLGLQGYVSSSYFSTKMNSTKDGYVWYGQLSKKDAPVPVVNGVVSTDAAAVTDTWRVYVRTGDDATNAVKYSSTSTDAARAAYNGTGVKLDDYLTPFRDMILNKKNGYSRSANQAALSGKYGIKGAAAYYNATSGGSDSATAVTAWKDVGIKTGSDTDGSYLEFTLLAPTNSFYFMYGQSSNMMQPVPKAFFELVTDNGASPKAYGSSSSDGKYTCVDNYLSLGAYKVEKWSDTEVVFQKDPTWFESTADTSIYQIPGVHIAILTGAASDKDLEMKEWIAGHLDEAALNSTYIDKYKNAPTTKAIPGDYSMKLNINACTQEQWVKYFGKTGNFYQTADEKNYYTCKPWMSNSDFLDALSFSFNRVDFAKYDVRTPVLNLFSSASMADPQNGIYYNNTAEHKDAVSSVYGDTTDTYGFNLDAARAKFKSAIAALEAAGTLKPGTTATPTELTIDCYFSYATQTAGKGKSLKQNAEDAFNNDPTVTKNGVYHLTFALHDFGDASASDAFEQMKKGQYDLGFGGVGGNALDPLNFLNILESNPTSGFCYNHSVDTSVADQNLVYDGKYWSLDALYNAGNTGIVAKNGAELPVFALSLTDKHKNEAGDGVFVYALSSLSDNAEFKSYFDAGKISAEYTDAVLDMKYAFGSANYNFSLSDGEDDDYLGYFTVSADKKTFTVTIPAANLWYYTDTSSKGYFGTCAFNLQLNYTVKINGAGGTGAAYCMTTFSDWATDGH